MSLLPYDCRVSAVVGGSQEETWRKGVEKQRCSANGIREAENGGGPERQGSEARLSLQGHHTLPMVTPTHPEMCFANLDIAQDSQVDIRLIIILSILHSCQQHIRTPVSPHFFQHIPILLLFLFLFDSHPNGHEVVN